MIIMKRAIKVIASIIRLALTLLLWIGAMVYLRLFLFEGSAAKSRTLSMFLFLAVVALAIFTVILGWRIYNSHKYGGRDRRKFASPVKSYEISRLFCLNAAAVEHLRESPYLDLTVTEGYDNINNVQKDVITISGNGRTYEISSPELSSEFIGYSSAMRSRGDNHR